MAGMVVTGDGSTPESAITNNGFFPDIDPTNFRTVTRQDKTVTSDRLVNALKNAIIAVNRELLTWKTDQVAEGHASLADVPADEVGEESILTQHYLCAVYSLAKAELIERYTDFDATKSGIDKSDRMDSLADEYRRDARWAIADIQGLGRTVVELI